MTINNSGDVAKLPPQPCVKQTAGYHGVDPKTVRRWIAEGGLSAKRSVMTRGERIAKLTEDKRFDAKDPKKAKPLGLPKTLVPKG